MNSDIPRRVKRRKRNLHSGETYFSGDISSRSVIEKRLDSVLLSNSAPAVLKNAPAAVHDDRSTTSITRNILSTRDWILVARTYGLFR